MIQMTTDDNLPQRLADEFSRLIRDALKPEDMAEVLRRNRTYVAGVCATHEFRDANLDMAEAFSHVMGRQPETTSDADAALWSAAWALAKSAQFPRKLELRHNAEGEPVYAFTVRGTCIVDPRLSEDFFQTVDPEVYYGLRPEELSAFDHANALLRAQRAAALRLAGGSGGASEPSSNRPSQVAVVTIADVKRRYPHAAIWHTGGGCHALRIDCSGGGYILITEHDNAQVPPDEATAVDVGRLAASGEEVEGAIAIAVEKLPDWINAALDRAAHPKNVADYFVKKLGATPAEDSLRELPVESACGQDCVKAIDAAAALLEHARAADGDDGVCELEILRIARRIVAIYWLG